jgi:NAD(P)-dependent dehydrogenase (short-subunit alcohol dehydrogenase family)
MLSTPSRSILLAGASRGLGLGLVRAFLGRGWQVVATARTPAEAPDLAHLAEAHGPALRIEALDLMRPESIDRLKQRLEGQTFTAFFAVAGISGSKDTSIEHLSHDAIAREFITNATAPVALAETLLPLVAPSGSFAFMTSILGSIASNAGGGVDLYRASKAALNMLAVNFAIRHKSNPVLLLHPGWVRTDMGGPSAPVDVETSCRGLADLIEQPQKPGIRYLDYKGQTLPW